tara:strand:+ start:2323 stop:2721 length:399 start_codon:yes stop_codon:yes gene_type:complete
MIVLKPIPDIQNVAIIPREILEVEDVFLTITDKTTGEVFEPIGDDLTVLYQGDLLRCNFTLNEPTLKNNRFYNLLIGSISQRTDEDDKSYIVYKDLVFVTDQSTYQPEENSYDINKGVYKEHNTGNNDYIIL